MGATASKKWKPSPTRFSFSQSAKVSAVRGPVATTVMPSEGSSVISASTTVMRG